MKKERLTERDIDRTLRRIKDAREFYRKKQNDQSLSEDDRELSEDNETAIVRLIDGMCEYVASVFDDNLKGIVRQAYVEEGRNEDWRAECERIEFGRKTSHDALISNIKLCDLICRNDGLEEIYGELPEEYKKDTSGLMGPENRSKPGVVETRHNIADWTFQFILGCSILDVINKDYENDREVYTEISKSYNQIGRKGVAKNIKEMTEPSER